jgi:hypothetical protein
MHDLDDTIRRFVADAASVEELHAAFAGDTPAAPILEVA